VEVEPLELVRRHEGFEGFWDTTLDLSRSFHDAVLSHPPQEIEEIKRSLERRFEPYTSGDGAIEVPGRTLVASATA
jgi:hypothetical protein